MKKNIIKIAFAIVFAAALSASGALSARASGDYVSWNSAPGDCPTTMIVNANNPGMVGNCYPTSVSANPGDTINVAIYYHNSGNAAAGNAVASLNPPTGVAQSTFNFTGFISGGGAQASSSATLTLPSAQTLTLSQVGIVHSPNPNATVVSNPNAIYTGLSIGQVNPPSDCPSNNQLCHEGYVIISYHISTTSTNTGNTDLCAINSFTSASNTIQSGQGTTLSWNTSGCTSVSLAGGTISSNVNAVDSKWTGALASTTTYVLTAVGSSGAPHSLSTIVNVHQIVTPTTCSITSFVANPSTVSSGGSSTLSWTTTSGCTSVSLTGGAVGGTYNPSGSVSTGSLTSSASYTLIAYGTNTSAPSYTSVTVTSAANCSITSFSATPNVISAGSSATLSWTASGCTTLTLTGGNYASTFVSGNSITTGIVNTTTTYTLTGMTLNQPNQTLQTTVTVNGSNACSVSFFTANPSVVAYGGSSTLSWSAPGCTSFSVTGGTLTGATTTGYSINTGPVNYTTTYTLNAYGTNTATATTTVSLTSDSGCVISSFYVSPSQVPYGSSTTLYWNTSAGCTNVYVSGPGVVTSYQMSGAISAGPINGSTSYTITASGNGSVPQSQTVVVTNTSYNQQNSAPIANTLAATNTNGTYATLNGYISTNNNVYNTGYNSGYNCTNSYYFQYGTTQYSLYSQTPSQTMTNCSGNISAYLSSLLPNTTYYFQLVASNGYGTTYGGTLSFYTGGNYVTNNTITAITSLATNISATSVRVNGLVTGTQNISGATVYFEYGTSPSLGLQTSPQDASYTSLTNYFDTISTQANTTYYFRIVASANGVIYRGSTVELTTPGVDNGSTVVYTTVNRGTGGGSSFVSLSITDQSQSIAPNDSVIYTVMYQNISSTTLTNVILNTILPTGITFKSATQGVLTTNNTVAANLGTLAPNAQGTITIQATADGSITVGNSLVTTATIAFTASKNAQDSAVAYVLNTVGNTNNNLAGLALFGTGFFPTSLLGWILLLGLILLLVMMARYFYHRANADRAASMAPVTHVHYDAPVPAQAQAPHPQPASDSYDSHGAYQGNNLPH